jgi:hypothetical protein
VQARASFFFIPPDRFCPSLSRKGARPVKDNQEHPLQYRPSLLLFLGKELNRRPD